MNHMHLWRIAEIQYYLLSLYDKAGDARFFPLCKRERAKRGAEGDLSIAYYATNHPEIPPSPPFAKGGTPTDRW